MPSYYTKRSRAKRSRSKSSKSSSAIQSTRRTKSSNSRTWPYAIRGGGPFFDPFPDKMRAILRYSEVVNLPLDTAGAPGVNLFRCNSIYDPNQSSIAGFQPYGHDTYESIYNHYRVLRATIVISPTSGANGILGCSITDDTTIQANYDTVRMTKGTIFKCLNPGAAQPTITQVWNHGQFMTPNSDALSASFGSNPVEQSYFHVWGEAKNSTATQGDMSVCVSITYECEFDELRDLGQS